MIVCEAFVGNVILKLYEGMGSVLIGKIKEGMMTSLRSKIGALLVKPALNSDLIINLLLLKCNALNNGVFHLLRFCHCEYWGGGREGQCPGERDFSSFEGM